MTGRVYAHAFWMALVGLALGAAGLLLTREARPVLFYVGWGLVLSAFLIQLPAWARIGRHVRRGRTEPRVREASAPSGTPDQ